MSRMDEAMQELVDAINVDLYDATDKMEQEYREFRKNPLVAEYLAAENAFCRVVQKVNWTLIEELDFEVGFEE